MTEPVTTHRPSIDFDDFERAMRDPAHSRQQEDDPLAELARLVGAHHDPYSDVFAREAAAEQPAPRAEAQARRATLDFASIEAGLRGSIPAHDAAPDHQHQVYGAPDDGYYDQHDPQAGHDAGWYDTAGATGQPSVPARSRRPVYAMAAVIVAGVVGIGVAFAYKGANSSPREIAMIKAAPGPTKIQPPADGNADPSTRDASILDKGQQTAPTKLVSREEQPVDLAQTVQNTPRDVGNGIMPIYNFSGTGTDASSVQVPPPPGQPGLAEQKPADALGIASDIEPIRVKTRSYRPDGTPIPNDQPPVAAIASAAPTAPKVEKAPLAKASTPRSVTPKSTTRITAPAKPIVVADQGQDPGVDPTPAAAAPVIPAHKPKPAKPVKVADATDPNEDAAATKPVASSGGGGFAVQLAAPGSEAEAKQASSRLSQKFASELSGHHLSFHKAASNGKSVFRVRADSLTREEATDICEKLKSSGGSCFVAKN